MKKILEVLEKRNYYYKIENDSRIELPFMFEDISIIIINNEYKVYIFEKNSSDIKKESKWYNKPTYAVNYIRNNII